MTVKLLSQDSWLVRALGSIGAKIFLILLAMGTTSAIGSLMITSAFDRITTNVDELTDMRLPTLAQSSDVGDGVSQAQNALISLLLASDHSSLKAAHTEEVAALGKIATIVPTLKTGDTGALETQINAVNSAVESLVQNRSDVFDSTAKLAQQIDDISKATQNGQRKLASAAQFAKIRMSSNSKKIVDSMGEALNNLVGREFGAVQSVMQLRADLALLAVYAMDTEYAQTGADRVERRKTALAQLELVQGVVAAALENKAIRSDLEQTNQSVAFWDQLISTPAPARAGVLRQSEQSYIAADQELSDLIGNMSMMLQFASEHVGASNLEATNDLFENEVRNLLVLLDINNQLALFRSTALEMAASDTADEVQKIGKGLPKLYYSLQRELDVAQVKVSKSSLETLGAMSAQGELLNTKLSALSAENAAEEASLAAAAAMANIAETAAQLGQISREEISQIATAISGDVGFASYRLNAILVISMVVIVLGLIATQLFILRPLFRLSETTERLAGGDMRPVEKFNRSGTEIVRIARALTVFRDGLVEKEETEARTQAEREARQAQQSLAVDSLATGLERLSEGDLTVRVTAELEGAYKKLRDDFNAAVERLEDSVRMVSNSGRSIVGNSAEISTVAQDLSQKSGETADTLADTAASLSRLSGSISNTAQASGSVSVSVKEAQDTASASIQVVDDTIKAMQDLQRSSEKIAQIIGVIDGIAQQTNLLALNAGVEAARAGSVGKGFAVVASEVRQLANKSKDAADEITQLVRESSEQVELGSELVQRTGRAIGEISDSVSNAAQQMSEIAAAAEEQSGDLQSINHAMIGLDNTTKTNDQLCQGVTHSSVGLSEEAQAMQAAIDRFQVGAADRVVREDAQDVAFLSAMP